MKMKVSVCYGLVLSATVLLAIQTGCKKTETTANNLPSLPSVSNVFPHKAADGGTILISGSRFTAGETESKVFFGDQPATILAVNDSSITVRVPAKAVSGKVTIETGDHSITAIENFIIDPKAPVISSFSPAKGEAGSEKTITGKNFTETSEVLFGEINAADVVFVSASALRVKVPEKAGSGRIRVVAGDLQSPSPQSFAAAPRIIFIPVMFRQEGQEMVIQGENFGATKEENIVSFNGGVVTPEEFVSASPTELRVKAPVAGKNGYISVTVAGMTHTYTDAVFGYRYTVTDFYPKHGPKTMPVTLIGKRFSTTPNVWVNGHGLPIISATPTEIKFQLQPWIVGADGTIRLRSNGEELDLPGTIEFTNIWVDKSYTSGSGGIFNSEPTFVLNNKIYSLLKTRRVVVYDITTNMWTDAGMMPAEISTRQYSSAVAYNGKAYVGVGVQKNDWYEFDPNQANPWRRLTDHPLRGGKGIAFVAGNKIYAGLGSSLGVAMGDDNNSIRSFDPAGNGTWGAPINVSALRANTGALTFTLNNVVYIAGGKLCTRDAGCTQNAQLVRFDPANTANPFTNLGIAPASTSDECAAFVVNEKAYIINKGNMFRYDVVANRWYMITHPEAAKVMIVAAHVVNNKVYGITNTGLVHEYRPDY